jgi:CheY-like chemotaxis protein
MTEPSADQAHDQARILVVDDEVANVRLLELLLGRAGYTDVRATCESRTVAATIRDWGPDLVLLDLAGRRVRRVDGGRCSRWTSRNDDDARARLFAGGVCRTDRTAGGGTTVEVWLPTTPSRPVVSPAIGPLVAAGVGPA